MDVTRSRCKLSPSVLRVLLLVWKRKGKDGPKCRFTSLTVFRAEESFAILHEIRKQNCATECNNTIGRTGDYYRAKAATYQRNTKYVVGGRTISYSIPRIRDVNVALASAQGSLTDWTTPIECRLGCSKLYWPDRFAPGRQSSRRSWILMWQNTPRVNANSSVLYHMNDL